MNKLHKAYVKVVERDMICVKCGLQGVDCHHVRGRLIRKDLECETDNIVLLCRSCHNKAHTKQFQEWFEEMYPDRWERIKGNEVYNRG